MKRLAALAFAGLSAFALTACQSEESVDGVPAAIVKATGDPVQAVEIAAARMRQGDVLGLIQATVPPAYLERMKDNWKTKFNQATITDEERAEFASAMAKLTASDAEAALFAEIEPELAKFEAEVAPQISSMILIAQGFAMQAVENHESMTDAQKQQVGEIVMATATWLHGARFGDRELARKSIGEAVIMARALGLTTLDEVHALDFEAAMTKAGEVMRGVMRVLAVYGLNLDATLEGVKATLVSQEGDSALVQVDYQIFGSELPKDTQGDGDQAQGRYQTFGAPISFQLQMVRQNGRWYGKDTLAQIETELAKPSGPATN